MDSILEEGRRRRHHLWRESRSQSSGPLWISTQADIHAVLSPEQREEYDARRPEFRKAGGGTHPGGDSGRGGACTSHSDADLRKETGGGRGDLPVASRTPAGGPGLAATGGRAALSRPR